MRARYRVLVAFVILADSFSVGAQSQLVVNEFVATNLLGHLDPDFDDSGDWLELYNSSGSDFDLTGCFLTDNLTDTTKWPFPVGTSVPSGGFLVVWCDGMNTGLHTSFKLNSLGEELGVYDADLTLLDAIVFGQQVTDVSRGRTGDGGASWSWFATPTPGASNSNAAAYEGVVHHVPMFSTKGGFFDSPLLLAITALNGEIRYTLDGTSPTASSDLYAEPFFVNSTSFLRARVYMAGHIPGPVVTHSYFFDPSLVERPLPVISLVTDPDFFWEADSGIYVQDFKPEWEQPLNVEFFENDGNNRAVFNERAGVKINGQNSWVLPQKMLGIYFRGGYGSGMLDYPLFHDRERARFNDFVLRAGGSDWAFTLMRDGLGQHLPQDNAHVGYQGFRPSIAFVNGEYMGIHNMRSRMDGDFIQENYDVIPESFDLIANDGEVEEGGGEAYSEMDALFNEDLSVDANFDAVAALVDVENYSDYWMTEIWSSNSSWGHNVKLWKPHDFGKWQFLFGDLDRGFSGSTNDGMDEFTQPQNDNYDYARTWLRHMLENAEYASYFAQRFTDHLHTGFHPERVENLIDEFAARIAEEVPFHAERWSGTNSSYGDGIDSEVFWQEEVFKLRVFAQERGLFMVSDLMDRFNLDDALTLSTDNQPEGSGTLRLNAFDIPGSPWAGPYFADMPFNLTAVPKPGFEFVGWSSWVSTSLVALQSEWRFRDTGVDLGVGWRESNFDDSAWELGVAELGYGDGDETTVVSYGPNANDKHITTYFRHDFEYNGATDALVNGLLSLRRDDGAVVYVNGVEVARSNMPGGFIAFEDEATEGVGGAAESALNSINVELSLVNGNNVIAVEIHQVSGTSSDISFDLKLDVMLPDEEVFSLENPLPMTLSADGGVVARYAPTGACLLPLVFDVDTTLAVNCSPYLALGSTVILPGVQVVVDAGVELWFPEDADLLVQGGLAVNGSLENPVILRNNSAFGSASWGHLKFDESTGINELNNIVLEGATKGDHPVHDRAALVAWFSTVSLEGATLTSNHENPIYAEHSDVLLSGSLIHSEVSGDLINIKYGQAHIEDCLFVGNEQSDTDAIDYDEVDNGVIRNTEISSFYGLNSDGIDLGEESDEVLVEGCLIHHCTDKGISIGQKSSAIIQNNTIAHCALGVAVKDLGSAQMDHMTFFGNQTAVGVYEKNIGLGGGTVSVARSLFSNSSDSPAYVDSLSTLAVLESFYDSDTLGGADVSWAHPRFVDPDGFDFSLLENSPALGAAEDGSDWGTGSHIFEAPRGVVISEIGYAGLENVDKEWLRLLNSGTSSVDLSGYILDDAVQFIFPLGTVLPAGSTLLVVRDLLFFDGTSETVLEWTSGQLANEGERIRLFNAFGIVEDFVRYEPAAPWPIPTVDQEALVLISSSLDNHFAESWTLDSPVVSVDKLPTDWIIGLHPNPASDRIHVTASSPMERVEIFNSMGQSLLEYNVDGVYDLIVEMKCWKPGMYLLRVNGTQVERFMVQPF